MKKSNSKIWGGRFSSSTDQLMEEFNSSIQFDKILYIEDIEGSIAHSEMLSKQNIISKDELELIKSGLKQIELEISNNEFNFSVKLEDIHMNIEYRLIEIIGEAGKKLHTARSRNDQVATDTRLWTKKSAKEIQKLIKMVMRSIFNQANKHQETIIPGFTHLQIAQPLSPAHHLLAYLEMFKRDLDYFEFSIQGADENVLGSAALAGSNYQLDQNLLNKKLGFSKSKQNSMDGVSDRDFCMYFLHACSMTSIHLGKLSSELILWSSNLVGLFNVHSEYSTGSSIMPQKRNPDSLELIRSKANIIRTKSQEFSNIISNLPLTYFKDFQEDKKIIFECFDELSLCLNVMSDVIKKSDFNKKIGVELCETNFATATDLADYLVIEKNIPFRKSYKTIADIVQFALKNKMKLSEISLKEFQKFEKSIDSNIYQYIDVKKSLSRKKTNMSTNPKEVSKKIHKFQKFLK